MKYREFFGNVFWKFVVFLLFIIPLVAVNVFYFLINTTQLIKELILIIGIGFTLIWWMFLTDKING